MLIFFTAKKGQCSKASQDSNAMPRLHIKFDFAPSDLDFATKLGDISLGSRSAHSSFLQQDPQINISVEESVPKYLRNAKAIAPRKDEIKELIDRVKVGGITAKLKSTNSLGSLWRDLLICQPIANH